MAWCEKCNIDAKGCRCGEDNEKTMYQMWREGARLDAYTGSIFSQITEETADKLLGLSTGKRYNEGKLRWRNVPMFLMKPLIEVGQYGEQKYETFNFLKGLPLSDTLDSLKRHLEKFESPYESDIDDESKANHLAHVAWNALVALHVYETRKDLDDRYKVGEDEKALYEEAKKIQQRGR